MQNKNNFRRENVRKECFHRLFIKYKKEYARSHGVENGDIKVFYPFKKNGQEDINGLILRVAHGQRGHYLLAWLFNNTDGGYSDVIRAWDNNGYELHPEDLKKLNERRKNKRNRTEKR